MQNQGAPLTVQRALRILAEWGATPDEACRILNIDPDAIARWSANPPPSELDTQITERLVLIVRISELLEILFPGNHSIWLTSRNESPTFNGVTPLSVMATGHLSEIRRVQKWLDGWAAH